VDTARLKHTKTRRLTQSHLGTADSPGRWAHTPIHTRIHPPPHTHTHITYTDAHTHPHTEASKRSRQKHYLHDCIHRICYSHHNMDLAIHAACIYMVSPNHRNTPEKQGTARKLAIEQWPGLLISFWRLLTFRSMSCLDTDKFVVQQISTSIHRSIHQSRHR
jgi:hypothetical protein